MYCNYPPPLPPSLFRASSEFHGRFTTVQRPFQFPTPHPWHSNIRHLLYIFVKQAIFRTVSHRGPLPLRDFSPPTKHECGETLGDLEPVYDLRLTTASEFTLPETVTCNRQPGGVRLCKAGRFSYGESVTSVPQNRLTFSHLTISKTSRHNSFPAACSLISI